MTDRKIAPKGYKERLYPILTKKQIQAKLDRRNPESALHGYIGNDNAVEQVCDILYSGFLSESLLPNHKGESNHSLGPGGIAIIGPPSVGKTELSRRAAKVMGLPFVECDRGVRNTEDLIVKMQEEFAAWGVDLVAQNTGQGVLKAMAPPCIIFFDEAQAIKGDWLLKATERNDATLISSRWVINCVNVFWVLCTTHRGKLSHAFDSRFTKVFLEAYTKDEVGQIVKGEFPDLPDSVCKLCAGFGRCVPREAKSFAEQVVRAAERLDISTTEAAQVVADRTGVDEYGFNRQHYAVMGACYKNPNGIALRRVADQLNCAEEDLEEYILPPLTVSTRDRAPLVRVSSRGYSLTDDGERLLRKKGYLKPVADFKAARAVV